MKKSLLGLLLAVALVVPAFAVEKGDMAIDAKLGFGLYNATTINNSGLLIGASFETPYSLAADFYYGIIDQLAIGIGVSHTFYTKLAAKSSIGDSKFAMTNVYLAVKPEAKLDSKIFSSLYGIGQIGYGFLSKDFEGDTYFDTKNGMYIGFGVGTEFVYGIILELIYSINYAKMAMGYTDVEAKYQALTLNIGYKFSL